MSSSLSPDKYASIYAKLRAAKEELEEEYKSRLSVLTRGMDAVEELMRPVLESHKDEMDKATVPTTSGTFYLTTEGRMEVTDYKMFIRSILTGSLPASVLGHEIKSNRRAVKDYVDEQKKRLGYGALTPEQKSVFDLNQCMPPGTKWSPFEKVIFRRSTGSV